MSVIKELRSAIELAPRDPLKTADNQARAAAAEMAKWLRERAAHYHESSAEYRVLTYAADELEAKGG